MGDNDKKNGTTSPSPLTERQKDKLAIERADVILKVQSGELTATEGAKMLNVSRKTYYEWQDKALAGMVTALRNGEPGRPPKAVDQEKEALKEAVAALSSENNHLAMKIKARQIMDELDDAVDGERAPRSRNQKKRDRKKRKK